MTMSAPFRTVKSIEEWKSHGLEFSVPLNRYRWSDSKELRQAAVEALGWCGLDNTRSGYKSVSHRLMKVILLNLFSTYLKSPTMFCGYSRDSTDYALDPRYNPTRFSFKAVKLIDAMANQGTESLIENYKGVQFGKFKRQARMRLTPLGVIHLMRVFDVTPEIAAEVGPQECIILRDRDPSIRDKDSKNKKQLDIPYDDTPKTIQMRRRLSAYNDLISRSDIEVRQFPAEGIPRGDGQEPYMLDYSRNKLRRIFSNGSWSEGGRFYGAWWIDLPEDWRQMIYIDGKRINEHDYSAIHPVIAYAFEGLNIFEELGSDPYYLPECETFPKLRSLLKVILNTALNSKSSASAVSSANKEINFKPDKYKWFRDSDLNVKVLLNKLIKRHKPIESWLGTNKSSLFQYIDSVIADEVMREMTKQDIPILAVHDSFICAVDQSNLLKKTMEEAFQTSLKSMAKPTKELSTVIKSSGITPERWNQFMGMKSGLGLDDFESVMKFIGLNRLNPIDSEIEERLSSEVALEEERMAALDDNDF